ncbi:MAG: SpoIIE family protein phosphatase [Anaerolineae bacterium]|nr:SpoIIE family protein phosphatase [Anaerolineae bacterium]
MELPCELELQVAVAKVSKYAVSESGDTVETIERPHGGLSIVLVDGQRSGKSAKAISNIVARKAVSLLADGVRDGAAARAAHDYLRTQRGGQVSATLNIVSVDLSSRTIVISRNSHCPVIVVAGSNLRLLDEPSEAIGVHARTRPVIAELPIALDTHLLVFTDGLLSAGERYGQPFDLPVFVHDHLQSCQPTAHLVARTLTDALLARAVELDLGRPGDDISVVVLSVVARQAPDDARRLTVQFPIPASLAGTFKAPVLFRY